MGTVEFGTQWDSGVETQTLYMRRQLKEIAFQCSVYHWKQNKNKHKEYNLLVEDGWGAWIFCWKFLHEEWFLQFQYITRKALKVTCYRFCSYILICQLEEIHTCVHLLCEPHFKMNMCFLWPFWNMSKNQWGRWIVGTVSFPK